MSKGGTRLRKRLFLNLDGTGQAQYTTAGVTVDGNKTSPAVSNVARIGRATLLEDVENGFEQVVYYQSGIGGKDELSILQKGFESGFGAGLISNIRDAYGFICNNYDYDDEIYITGFSRGAYTARSVAGLIGKVGILTQSGLKLFYEAFDYYRSSNKEKGKPLECPVTEEAGTTRVHYPNTNPPRPIKIRAVGVWDTVGGLRDNDLVWHDTTLGKHIEHGYHILSLDERRGYFRPELWECPDIPRSLENLEQCWMAGDHSDIGGSWDDSQLADISLAWMMSRFDALGVKFDQTYLYDEYKKLNKYIKARGKAEAYPAHMSPRQWGEGRSHEVWRYLNFGWGGYVQRTPGEYPRLHNTNETMHPAVRYRHCCKNQRHLGADDKTAYDPSSLKGWTYPPKQTDGRIGEGRTTTSHGPLKYTKPGARNQTVQIPESPMGKYEMQLLALYDRDSKLQARDGSIWEKVLGSQDGPPQEIKDGVAQMIKPPENPYNTKPPTSEKLYIGSMAAVSWDEQLFGDYAALSSVFRVGGWNGNGSVTPGSPAPFCSLGSIQLDSVITAINVYYNAKMQALSGLIVYHNDGITERYSWGEEGFELSTLRLGAGERIVAMETKAFKPPGREALIQGVRFRTDKARVWDSSEYDFLSDGMVGEEVPTPAGQG
ncbi:MAG: hypothetical protein L6R36_007317, partial [Xanthoria steineri]